MTIDPPRMRFGPDQRFEVVVEPAAIASMLQNCIHAKCRETGGILIGRYDETNWVATVVEATPKPADSWAGWFWFRRGNRGLEALLQARWNDGLYYLGEWHFHPRGAADPSGADFRAMERIAQNPLYACAAPLLMILGGRPPSQWDLSASIVRPVLPPVRLYPQPGQRSGNGT